MSGYTPFLFSSEREQALSGKWYEMWINPESVNLEKRKIKTVQHTVGSIVVLHWRDDLVKLSISGKSGWVKIESKLDQVSKGLLNGDPSYLRTQFSDTFKGMVDKVQGVKSAFKNRRVMDGLDNLVSEFKPSGDAIDNSPRIFIRNLRKIMYEDNDFFYKDVKGKIIVSKSTEKDGNETYNKRYVQIFTKQYPNGITLGGYCEDFKIDEKSDDQQAIPYTIEFVVESSGKESGSARGFLQNLSRNLIRL